MHPRTRLFPILCVLVGAAILSACFSLPSVRFDPPFGYGEWVVFEDSIVVGPPTPALAGNFVNRKDSTISLRVEIDEIDGADDCASSFGLGPKQTKPYACKQRFVAEGKRYRIDVRVYKDSGETNLAERIQRIATLEKDESGKLVLVGRPLK